MLGGSLIQEHQFRSWISIIPTSLLITLRIAEQKLKRARLRTTVGSTLSVMVCPCRKAGWQLTPTIVIELSKNLQLPASKKGGERWDMVDDDQIRAGINRRLEGRSHFLVLMRMLNEDRALKWNLVTDGDWAKRVL